MSTLEVGITGSHWGQKEKSPAGSKPCPESQTGKKAEPGLNPALRVSSKLGPWLNLAAHWELCKRLCFGTGCRPGDGMGVRRSIDIPGRRHPSTYLSEEEPRPGQPTEATPSHMTPREKEEWLMTHDCQRLGVRVGSAPLSQGSNTFWRVCLGN